MSVAADTVREAWVATIVGAGGDPAVADETAAELLAAYAHSNRSYHGLHHLRDVLSNVDMLGAADPLTDDERAAVVLAGCAHDVVHDGEAGNDERASARWAGEALLRAGAPPAVIARVQALVLTTIDHVAPPGDATAAVLCDADLGILGADPNDYDAYVAAVRSEYAHVSDEEWRQGRADVLRALLAKEPLYATAAARRLWAAAAHANISRELAALAIA